MVKDISGASGTAADFSAEAVIDTAATLGDRLEDMKAIAMHSAIYTEALKNDLIQFIPQSQGLPIKTFRGLAVILDDNLSPTAGVYTTILMGPGAVGFAVAPPRTGYGTELFRIPGAGNGGGQSVLHTRWNMAMHPLGFAWSDGTGGGAIAGDSPSLADLAAALWRNANPYRWPSWSASKQHSRSHRDRGTCSGERRVPRFLSESQWEHRANIHRKTRQRLSNAWQQRATPSSALRSSLASVERHSRHGASEMNHYRKPSSLVVKRNGKDCTP
jgi:hypothetical protein